MPLIKTIKNQLKRVMLSSELPKLRPVITRSSATPNRRTLNVFAFTFYTKVELKYPQNGTVANKCNTMGNYLLKNNIKTYGIDVAITQT